MIHRFFNYLSKNQVLFALFLIASGWIIIQIRDILLSVFLSYIIMASILPLVIFLRKKRFPKVIAVIIAYTGMVITFFLLILSPIPFVIEQIQKLILSFPDAINKASQTLGIQISIDANQIQNYISNEINTISSNAFTLTTQLFGGIFTFLMIFVITFYMLLYYDEFKKLISRLFPHKDRSYVFSTLDKINDKLGAWLRGQFILSVFVALISWVTLTAMGIPSALPLAILSGLLEIVPTLGPILSSIPAIIVALTISPQLAISVTIAYILIQLIENNLLVPKVMERAVGLNPIVIILGVLIGANLIGITGALLAIPLITFVIVIYKSIQQKPT